MKTTLRVPEYEIEPDDLEGIEIRDLPPLLLKCAEVLKRYDEKPSLRGNAAGLQRLASRILAFLEK